MEKKVKFERKMLTSLHKELVSTHDMVMQAASQHHIPCLTDFRSDRSRDLRNSIRPNTSLNAHVNKLKHSPQEKKREKLPGSRRVAASSRPWTGAQRVVRYSSCRCRTGHLCRRSTARVSGVSAALLCMVG